MSADVLLNVTDPMLTVVLEVAWPKVTLLTDIVPGEHENSINAPAGNETEVNVTVDDKTMLEDAME